jgi:hypothetical protein
LALVAELFGADKGEGLVAREFGVSVEHRHVDFVEALLQVCYGVAAAGADTDVLEEVELESVGVAAARQVVPALAAADLVRSRTTVDKVLSGAAVDAVTAAATGDEISPVIAGQAIRLRVARDRVGLVRALDGLDRDQRVDAGAVVRRALR